MLLLTQLSLLLVEVDEHHHLRAEDVRLEWLGEVIDGADGISFEDVLLFLADGGEKDDRDEARAFARLDEPCGLEPTDPRHLYIQEDHGHIMGQQFPKCFIPGIGSHDRLTEWLQERFEREEIFRTIVNDQDLHWRERHLRFLASGSV